MIGKTMSMQVASYMPLERPVEPMRGIMRIAASNGAANPKSSAGEAYCADTLTGAGQSVARKPRKKQTC